jgi:alanyl aminopeptidase
MELLVNFTARWLVLGLVACSAPPTTKPRAMQRSAAAARAPAPQTVPGLRLPDDVTPLRYDLRLTIDPALEAFGGDVAIRVHVAKPTSVVWLAAAELDIESETIDGAPATSWTTGQVLALHPHGTLAPGDHTITIRYTGHTRHDQEGLFRQQANGVIYEFSQGESLLARRIVPCFDEPRWKTPWHVTLVVPTALVALGNMPAVREEVHGALREVDFAETPPMPSYLLAVAVGPFELVDVGAAGANHVPVRVAALGGDKAKVGVARLTGRVLAAIEAYVGSPLPWPKLDLVVVPHLFGAMENPGLITFDAEMLVGDPKELAPHFVRVAAHELAHQWFGNSVTPVWWDDLWLSEAFASWLGDKVSAQLGVLDDASLELALDREHALEADADSDARPLRRKVERYEDPDTAFDAISYEKGRAVLATFEAYIGETRLREALRGYLAAHANATATTRDLLAALPDVGDALAGYLDHAGAPVVDVTVTCDKVVLHARDHLRVPVCVRTDSVPRTCVLAADHTEIALPACPGWVWPSDGAGYYQVAWQGAHAPVPPASLQPAERIAVGDDAAAAFVRGELAPADALAELRLLAEAADPYSKLGALAIARVLDPIVAPAQRDAWETWLAARFADRLGPAALLGAGSPADREVGDRLRLLISARHLPPATIKRARTLLARVGATPELVAAADLDRDAVARLVEVAGREQHDDVIDALAMGPAGAADIVVRMAADWSEPALPAIDGYLQRAATRDAMWAALRGNLSAVVARLDSEDRGELLDATAALCDRADDVASAFASQLGHIPDGERRLTHAVAQIRRCAALRARTGNLPL